jgi:hypothetical protein
VRATARKDEHHTKHEEDRTTDDPGVCLVWRVLSVTTIPLKPRPLDAAAGWAVLTGIVCRFIWERVRGSEGEGDKEVFAAGIIAGDAIFSFFNSITKSLSK